MSWNYAELSKAAKESGSPEQLMDNLINEGKAEMLPVVGLAFLAGSAITVGVQKAVRYCQNKREETKQRADDARIELIQGIKEYDEAQKGEDTI